MRNFLKELSGCIDDQSMQPSVVDNLCVLEDEIKQQMARTAVLNTYFTHRNLPSKQLANLMGVKPSTVTTRRAKISKEWYSLLGDDFFTQARAGNAKEVQRRVEAITNGADVYSMLPTPFYTYLNQPIEVDVNVAQCREEIKAFIDYSNYAIQAHLGKLDQNKIAYLLQVIQGKAGSAQDRAGLLSVINKHNKGGSGNE